MNFRQMNIKKLMNSIFTVLIGFSALSTLAMVIILNKVTVEGGSYQPVIILMIFNLGMMIIFAFSSAYAIRKRVLQPLDKLKKDMKEISQGRLSTKISYESEDEIGELAEHFRNLMKIIAEHISAIEAMTSQLVDGDFELEFKKESTGDFRAIDEAFKNLSSSLAQTMQQMNESFSQVASGADHVSEGAQSLSQGAAEQASSIEQLSATITEISEQVNHNAGSADVANQKVAKLGMEIQKSSSQMEEMLAAMSEINQKSGEISKIIKAIEDIAFQTNILALNAAVEAARAGSAGKGFAVVADEVRNLANKSAEAAKNTAVLIEGSIRAVDNGTRIANNTAMVLGNIDCGSREIVENVDQISQKSQEQAVSIKQITKGIDQIAAVIQMNSATSEEAAAASQELSSQAHIMRAFLQGFRYDKKATEHRIHFGIGNSIKSENLYKKEAINNRRPQSAIPTEKAWKSVSQKREVKPIQKSGTNIIFNPDKY